VNDQINAEAAQWFVEFRAGDVDAAGRVKFDAWLRTSPEHMRAYLELAAIWNEGSRLGPSEEPVENGNVVALPVTRTSAPRVSRERRGVTLLAVAASVTLAVIGAWAWGQRHTYSTGIGEQRSLALEDGSSITLNAMSRIRVRFTATRRDIELIEGQAFFRVAKDQTRPFIVESEGTLVRAVGTEFDVYQRTTGTTVTVLEGRVAVTGRTVTAYDSTRESLPEPTNSRSVVLAAGEQAILTAQSTVKPKQPNVAAATAWTQGRLIFESATLAEVVEEMNRYNQRRLVVEGAQLATFRITGVFASTDPQALIRFLQARPGIVVTERSDEVLITPQPHER
jgi:transmembrane sensor